MYRFNFHYNISLSLSTTITNSLRTELSILQSPQSSPCIIVPYSKHAFHLEAHDVPNRSSYAPHVMHQYRINKTTSWQADGEALLSLTLSLSTARLNHAHNLYIMHVCMLNKWGGARSYAAYGFFGTANH